jgi:hypothetical protein
VVAPTGTYTDVTFPPRDGGYDDLAWRLTIRTDPSPDGYFWSHQFWLEGGEAGYLGLQTHNAELGGPIAIFSIWRALDAEGPAWAAPFGGEGTGWSARIPYRWSTDVPYDLRVERGGVDSGGAWWRASVTDPTGRTAQIGHLLVPAHWGGLAASSVMWTERYAGPLRSCADLRHAVAEFTEATTDRGRTGPTLLRDHLANPVSCPNSRTRPIPGGSRHEMGVGSAPAWPDPDSMTDV